LAEMGFDKEKLGVHSLRKGAATFWVSGSTNPPNQASIDLRGGWSQGKIKDVYQHSLPQGRGSEIVIANKIIAIVIVTIIYLPI
jgi:hypothetical protein